MTDEQMRYPVGKFHAPVSYTVEDIRKWTATIREFPGRVRQAIIGLNDKQLDTPYRTGGWTLRQVVHHVADSHMNSLMRFKWALTEDNPTIKPYEEADWALLADYRLPVEPSLRLLEGLHQHWVALLEVLQRKTGTALFCTPKRARPTGLKRHWPYMHGTASII